MSESKRKFFSGRSVEQAVVAAANHYGIHPDEVKYREVEKRHGFVRTRRNAVIVVNPEDYKKPAAQPAAEGGGARDRADGARTAARPAREERDAVDAPEEVGAEEERRENAGEERRPRRRDARRDRGARPARGGRGAEREEPAEPPEAEETRRPGGRSAPGPWWQAEPVTEETEEMEDVAGPELEGAEADEDEGEERDEEDRYRFVERTEGLKRRERPGAPVGEGAGGRRGRERRRDEVGRRQRRGGGRGRGGGRERREAPAPAPPPPLPRPAPRAERLPRAEEDLAEAAQDALDRLLEFAGVEAEAEFFENEGRLEVELWGPDDHLLLEDDGQLLLAIEHLLPRMLRSLYGDSMPVRVDCDEFHARREERLRGLALETAEEVRRRGKPRTLEELDPAERRIVHLSLADVEDVRTESLGDGYFKRVKIFPT